MEPSSMKAAFIVLASRGSDGFWMTTLTGRPYSPAKSKSRWSWAGTAMTMPVPYSIST